MSACTHTDGAQIAVRTQIAVIVHANSIDSVALCLDCLLESLRVNVKIRIIIALINTKPVGDDVWTSYSNLYLRWCATE